MSFSKLDRAIGDFEKIAESNAMFRTVEPWSKSEATEPERKKRVAAAIADFWFFDKTYFPAEMYSEGFSDNGAFHKKLFNIAQTPGVQIVLAARQHGKTVLAKKLFAWKILSGQLFLGATLSETLPTSRNILADIYSIINENAKINFDFKPDFGEANADQITVRLPETKTICRVMAFSEGRSLRGATKLFARPQFVLCDDIETRQSALGSQSVVERIKTLQESRSSMQSSGTMLVLGNNFDERCAMNRLFNEQKDGVLPKPWKVHVFPAWNGKRPLWPERFNAKSETALRKLLQPADDAEWQAEYMQEPRKADGNYFVRLNPLPWYGELPNDARGVVYFDQNCSLKGKGDFTAGIQFLYSPSTDLYYWRRPVCRSFAATDKLLDILFSLIDERVLAVGLDGHVGQESIWTNIIRTYCRERLIVPPRIVFQRITVDDYVLTLQDDWNDGKIRISREFETPDGRRFLDQLFAFVGKKADQHDDAPDAATNARVLLHDRRLGRRVRTIRPSTVIRESQF